MSEFLEQLPKDANLGLVVHDLYSKATKLVKGLDALRTAEFGEGSILGLIPGTELVMGGEHRSPRDRGRYSTIHIGAKIHGDVEEMLAVSSYSLEDGFIQEPSEVAGNREDELFGGDYSVRQQSVEEENPGFVVVRLSRFGKPFGRLDEPVGTAEADPETRVDELGDEDRARLEVVTRGIVDNMTIIELIRDGTPALDVFEMMGR